jgi:hypothetical protein
LVVLAWLARRCSRHREKIPPSGIGADTVLEDNFSFGPPACDVQNGQAIGQVALAVDCYLSESVCTFSSLLHCRRGFDLMFFRAKTFGLLIWNRIKACEGVKRLALYLS